MFARKFPRLMTAGLFAAGLVASAHAAEVKPAVVYDLGGKFDKSFNEGVFNGAQRFTKETGIKFRDLEIQNDAQREQVLRKFAKDGYSPIMTVGFAWETALKKVAAEFPNTKFGIIDDVGRPAQRPVDRVQGAGRFVCRRRDRRRDLARPEKSVSSAAWISRSFRSSSAATRRASNMLPAARTKSSPI